MKKEGHLPCRLVDFPRRDKEQTDFFFVVSYSASSLENRQTFKFKQEGKKPRCNLANCCWLSIERLIDDCYDK
jgi:hypothetical protein